MFRTPTLLVILGSIALAPSASGGPVRPCDADDDCLSSQECHFPIVHDCATGPEGYCVPAGTPSCNPDSGLVCGCDGDTYLSECDAEGQIGVEHLGACQIGDSCGGQTCTGNNFCQLPFGACSWYAPDGCVTGPASLLEHQYETDGVCVPYPTSCSEVSDPVCACGSGEFFLTGGTYLNACVAAQSFRSIAHEGSCGGSTCGGFGGWNCPTPGDVCIQDCQVCGFDISGRCEPEVSECADYCAPVCDCQGEWHKNRCEWKSAWGASSYPATLSRPAGCDELYALKFANKTDILTYGGRDSDNIYRATLTASGQPGPWTCVESGNTQWPYPMVDTPPPGEVWAIGVTRVLDGVEGTLGWGGAGCAERTIANPCPP